MVKKVREFLLLIVIGLIFSGCIGNSEPSPVENPSEGTLLPENKGATENTENLQQQILELENKIDSMQGHINELQARTELVGLDKLKPSNETLFPRIPFRIEIKFSEWQPSLVYTFKENEVELRSAGYKEYVSYVLYPNNNTVRINSKKYDYYGLKLFENHIVAVYDSDWITWVSSDYKIIPPKYNPLTQKYELN